MIWLTWRQSRLEAVVGGTALALLTMVLLWTGHEMTATYRDAGLPTCVADHATDDGCWSTASAFISRFSRFESFLPWLNFVPLVLGLLLAAPTVFDLEHGTYRLAWTQSVTRRRWLAAKVAIGLTAAVIATALLVALWTWWRGPLDALQGRFDGNAFDFEGTVPVAYTVFAFALCLAAGTLMRRAVPSAAVALASFLGARVGVENRLRPHYLAPIKVVWDSLAPAPTAALTKFGTGDWVISEYPADASGHALALDNTAIRACMSSAPPDGSLANKRSIGSCLHDHGVFNAIVYQPAHRFWTFQLIETAIFLGLAAILIGLAFWGVSRRIS